MFKIKDGYKLGLQTPETMKIFVAQIDKTKSEENVPRLEVIEVVLIQYNL